ncbi:MAG TPA: acyltransferase [Candidatus Binatia bacterium]|nr:acyltransferase [Candidatus Binatia bacterium]
MFGFYRYALALLVAFGHIHWAFQGVWNWTGGYAVFSFFALSGYLMTRVLHVTYGYGTRGLLAYGVNRFLRIYPAYWAALILSLAILYLAPVEGRPPAMPAMPATLEAYFRNFALLGLHTFYKPTVVPPAWSLHLELIFYVLLGLGISRTRGRTMVWIAVMLAWTAWAVLSDLSFGERYGNAMAAALPFALGAGLHHAPGFGSKTFLAAASVCFAANLLAPPALWGDPLGPARFYVSLALTVAVIASLRHLRWHGKWEAWDRRLGDLSYPIFLVHAQIGHLVTMLLPAQTSVTTVFLVSLLPVHLIAVALDLSVAQPIEAIRRRVRPHRDVA